MNKIMSIEKAINNIELEILALKKKVVDLDIEKHQIISKQLEKKGE